MTLSSRASLMLALSFLAAPQAPAQRGERTAAEVDAVKLQPCRVPDVDEELRCGVHLVPEDRASGKGPMLPLRIIVMPARTATPAAEPIFWAPGGPGESATGLASYFADNWRRRTHDLVLIDQRGTGEGHRLSCPLPGSDDDIQPYLRSFLHLDSIRACRKELEKTFDLTRYTTPVSVEDYDEVRRALGHERIHLHAASYGSRFALSYLRKYDRHVATALLYSLVPFAHRLPLYFASGDQDALDRLLADCEADAPCHQTYPDPKSDLSRVLNRLRARPARVTIPHPATGTPAEVTLTAQDFVRALRGVMYWSPANHAIPMLLRQAASGDFVRLVRNAIDHEREGRDAVSLGMLLSVTCSEDVNRIRREEVGAATAGSFTGPDRVEAQIAACSEWPKGIMPDGYYDPFQTRVPTILISGWYDPATGPRWGEEAKRYFADSVHLIVPEAHTPDGDCVGEVAGQLLRTGSLAGLDSGCISRMRPPPFRMPGE